MAVLEEIRDNQKSYYDNEIKDKENYSSVISFASQVEKSLGKKASDILQSKSFVILEGFSPGWGNFQGLIWNDKEAYSYRKLSTENKLKIARVDFDQSFKEKTGIGMHIINRLDKWDIQYIGDLDNKIGMETLDGYNFIASRVTNQDGNMKVETIAFEQFIDEGQSN